MKAQNAPTHVRDGPRSVESGVTFDVEAAVRRGAEEPKWGGLVKT
jgi:hypothetical protein